MEALELSFLYDWARSRGGDAAARLAWEAEVLAGSDVECRGCGRRWNTAARLAWETEVLAVDGGGADLTGDEQ